MNKAMTLYKSNWHSTNKTNEDRKALKAICVDMAEPFDAQTGEGFKFDDNSKLIFTSDNVQVSLF